MLDRFQVIQNVCLGLLVITLAAIAGGGLFLVGCGNDIDSVEAATWKHVAPPHPGLECWRRLGERATICVRSDGE
jgi:hypothetical protein